MSLFPVCVGTLTRAVRQPGERDLCRHLPSSLGWGGRLLPWLPSPRCASPQLDHGGPAGQDGGGRGGGARPG